MYTTNGNGNGAMVYTNGNGHNGNGTQYHQNGNGYKPELKQLEILPPHNVEAEEAVIGSLLIDGDSFYLVDGEIDAGDFYLQRHAWIFEAIEGLNRENIPVDLVTISDKLEQMGRIDDIGMASLTDFITITPTSIHLKYYADIVKCLAVARRLIKAAGAVAQIGYKADERSPEKMVADALDLVNQVYKENQSGGIAPAKRAAGKLLDSLESTEEKIYLGITDVDKILGGLERSKLYLLAGRPGMGKSGGAVTIIKNNMMRGKRVLIFSLEMPEEDVIGRLAAQLSGISYKKIRDNEVTEKAYAEFLSCIFFVQNNWDGLIIDDTPALNIATMRARARRAKALYNIDLIIVDHLSIATSDKNYSDTSNANDIADQALAMAKETKTPVLGLVQLNRSVESRTPKRPMLMDLRQGGKFEENADGVMFIYRDDYYNPDTDKPNIAEINVAKNRGGPTGVALTYWKKTTTEFIDLAVKTQPLDYN